MVGSTRLEFRPAAASCCPRPHSHVILELLVRHDSLADYERAIGQALVKVRELHADGALPPVLDALILLAPPRGFFVQVELRPYTDHARQEEYPRDEQWDPRNGEVHLTYEPARDARDLRDERRGRGHDDAADEWRGPPAEPPTAEQAVADLVGVVANAEADPAFKFLALKYLRDQLLPRRVAWGSLQHEAQIQINRAIDAGILVTSKVENPRAPQYPVTAVALNRADPRVQELLATLARRHGDLGEGGEAEPLVPEAAPRGDEPRDLRDDGEGDDDEPS